MSMQQLQGREVSAAYLLLNQNSTCSRIKAGRRGSCCGLSRRMIESGYPVEPYAPTGKGLEIALHHPKRQMEWV